MGQDATPDPAEIPLGDGSADDPDDQAADDDQGLRWAALLAAFIDDTLSPGPGTPRALRPPIIRTGPGRIDGRRPRGEGRPRGVSRGTALPVTSPAGQPSGAGRRTPEQQPHQRRAPVALR